MILSSWMNQTETNEDIPHGPTQKIFLGVIWHDLGYGMLQYPWPYSSLKTNGEQMLFVSKCLRQILVGVVLGIVVANCSTPDWNLHSHCTDMDVKQGHPHNNIWNVNPSLPVYCRLWTKGGMSSSVVEFAYPAEQVVVER